MYGFILKLRLFVTSFVPLFFALFFRLDDPILSKVCLILVASGLLDGLNLVYWIPRRISKMPVKFDDVSDAGADVSGYMVSYLLPFLMIGKPSPGDLYSYGTYLAVLALIYARSNMVQINPVLYLLGHRVNKAVISGHSVYAITSKDLKLNESYLAVRIGPDIYII